jgi:integrase
MKKENIESLEYLTDLFFNRAQCIKDTSRKKFWAENNLSWYAFEKEFPVNKWSKLQDNWALVKIKCALDELSQSTQVGTRGGVRTIIRILRGTGIGRYRFRRLAADEWDRYIKDHPTGSEKILRAVKDLVAGGVSIRGLTQGLIFKTADVPPRGAQWLRGAVVSARLELLKHPSGNDAPQPPEGINALASPAGWVDLDANTWDLRHQGGSCLNRYLLRDDIGDIAWLLMRDALLSQQISAVAINGHFSGYRSAGELLGDEVPDVRKATLERVQRAWLNYEAKPRNLVSVRAALKRIFTHLSKHEMESSGIDVKEMLLISVWLYTSVRVPHISPNQDFLTDAEINAAIAGCLTDIKAGLDFTESGLDLLTLPTLKNTGGNNAVVVVQWGASLILLLMLFTGLRPQSALNIKVGDWAEIRHGLFALIWYHGKKREEKVAILATSLAFLIDQYVERTAKLRRALGTKNVFLLSNSNNFWSTTKPTAYIRKNFLPLFVKRHGLERGRQPLKITSQMLRRTYVTRELYMGCSIWALRLQLGHESLQTTRRYGKIDLFEHPGEVSGALDEYGRASLARWHHPLMLGDMDPSERAVLLGVKDERHQDIGLCRFDCFHKILVGNPPPCSLCEHLVTGPEFHGAWEAERKQREEEIKSLESTSEACHLLAQKKSEYDMFLANLTFVKGERYS